MKLVENNNNSQAKLYIEVGVMCANNPKEWCTDVLLEILEHVFHCKTNLVLLRPSLLGDERSLGGFFPS